MTTLLITIDSFYIDENLVDFPILVSLNVTNLSGTDLLLVSSNPLKVSFTDSFNTSLYAELVTATATGVQYWVKIPSIVSTTDTLIIFRFDLVEDNITYVGITGTVVAQSVWSNDYRLVYHMSQDPSTGAYAILDSTLNENHGTSYGTMASDDLNYDELFGYNISFDGVNDYIFSKNSLGISGATKRTLTTFIKPNTTSQPYWGRAAAFGGNSSLTSFVIGHFQSSGNWGFSLWDNDYNSGVAMTNFWTAVSLCYNGSNVKAFVNETLTNSWSQPSINTTNSVLAVCASTAGSFIGKYDVSEIFVASIDRSDAWIKAEVTNLNNNLITLAKGFTVIGTVKDISGVGVAATITIFLQESTEFLGTVVSDSYGSFTANVVVSETCCVVANACGYLPSVVYGIVPVNEDTTIPELIDIVLHLIKVPEVPTSSLSGFSIDCTYIDEDLINFPVMLNINVDNFTELEYTNLFEITTTTTGLRFNVLDQNSNYCYTEVFYYDYLARELLLYTKIPEISATQNTKLYLYSSDDYIPFYTGFTGSPGAQNVWDSNYVGVYHFAQIPSSGSYAILDSTVNERHLISTASMGVGSLTDGLIGPAINFDGDDDRLMTNLHNYSSLQSSYTIESLHKFDTLSNFSRVAGVSNNTGCPMAVAYSTTNKYDVGVWSDDAASVQSFTLNVWNYAAHTYDGSKVGVVVNGIEDSVTNTVSLQNLSSVNLWFGFDSRAITSDTNHFDGKINNAKVSKIKRSAAWLKATYYGVIGQLVNRIAATTCEGTINYPSAIIRMYRRSTGELIDETIPTISGTFSLFSLYYEDHYVVALHDYTQFNALIYDFINPKNIIGN